MSKGLCHALLCSLPGTGGDAGLHPAPLLNPAPAGHKAALSIERGCEHSRGVARDLSCSSGQQM